ncbi:hypothetical protein QVD17_24647 [Tagetes erecta]|uniref:Uncharacterized protein n=1 Tax=Tagetes erecta TaxID=13708 RepID=A0AAD8KLT5_TARER|nr:hypothetical protein QVD17_24647 [Tagetes erecta]
MRLKRKQNPSFFSTPISALSPDRRRTHHHPRRATPAKITTSHREFRHHRYGSTHPLQICHYCASSSSQIMAENGIHRFLQFEDGSQEANKFTSIQHKPLVTARTLDWTVLDALGEKDRAKALLPLPWRRLFDIKRPQYRELVLEFCSSFKFRYPTKRLHDDQIITFRTSCFMLHCVC